MDKPTQSFGSADEVWDYANTDFESMAKRLSDQFSELNGDKLAQWRCLIGVSNPPSVALASNLRLVRYGMTRTFEALKAVVPPSCMDLKFMTISDGSSPSTFDKVEIDLRHDRNANQPFLKDQNSHYLAVPCLRGVHGNVKSGWNVIGWGEGRHGSVAQGGVKRPRKSRQPTYATEFSEIIHTSDANLAELAYLLWSPASIGELALRKRNRRDGWRAPKPNDAREKEELNIFLIRASIRLQEIAFAHGRGATVLKSVMREIGARALSFNLGGDAPLHASTVARFLSEVVVDDQGKCLKLPSITHVK